MDDPTKHTIRRTLILALTLTALLAPAAVPAAAAPSHPDRTLEVAAPSGLDLPTVWSDFTGWLNRIWDLHRVVIDPDGEQLTAPELPDTDVSYTTAVDLKHRVVIDPDGSK